MPITQAYVGLGSNLSSPTQDSAGLIRSALRALATQPACELMAVSPFYRSAALKLSVDAPPQPDFCNAVACLRTRLDALGLLELLLTVEQDHGRQRSPGQRWQARQLDLDLLMFGALQMHGERLHLPHPEIARRPFVLQPWADIAPDIQIPGLGALASYTAQKSSLVNWAAHPE